MPRWAAIILTLLLATATRGADRLVLYVDRDVAGGTEDGTSWTNACQTMNEVEALNLDLVGLDKYAQIYFRASAGTDDTNSVTWAGWNTDATRTVELIEDPNRLNHGAWNPACYTLCGTHDAYALAIQNEHLTVTGIQIDGMDTEVRYGGISISTNCNHITVRNCIIKGYPRVNGFAVVFEYGYPRVGRSAYNNIIFDSYVGIRVWQNQGNLLNNTVCDCSEAGIQLIRGVNFNGLVQNNLLAHNGTDWFVLNSDGVLTTGCNYTLDATSPDGSERRWMDPNFLDQENGDYRLDPDMAALIDDCVTQSLFATDINDTVRSHWDAGAFETIEGEEPPGPPVPPIPTAYFVDPDTGVDDLTHGDSRATPWQTVKYAAWNAPDLVGGATVYLMEGDHGHVTINKLPSQGYPARSHYVTIRPDPCNVGDPSDAAIRSLYMSERVVPFFLRFDHCWFHNPLPEHTLIPAGTAVIYVSAANYLQFVDCNVIGTIGHSETDNRPHTAYCVTRVMSICEAGVGAASNVLIQRCTIHTGGFGMYMTMSGMGENFQVLNNDVSKGSCNGIHIMMGGNDGLEGEPMSKWPLIQGNYVHNQARVWYGDYSDAVHASGIAATSGRVRFNGNIVDCYGTTASIRNYPTAGVGMTELYLTNNLVIHPLNYTMQLFNLESGSKVFHNTCVGRVSGEEGKFFFWNASLRYGAWCYETWNYTPVDRSDLQVCNNVFVGYNGAPPAGSKFTGNMLWSLSDPYTQTSLDAAFPGNKLYCASVAVYPAVDDDANSVVFTTPGVFFDNANLNYEIYIDDANIYRVVGDPGKPDHWYDIPQTSDAVDFGSITYAVATDFYGSAREMPPDAGFDEAPVAEGDDPDPPPPPSESKFFLFRKLP